MTQFGPDLNNCPAGSINGRLLAGSFAISSEIEFADKRFFAGRCFGVFTEAVEDLRRGGDTADEFAFPKVHIPFIG